MRRWLKTVGPLANKRVPSLQWRRDDAKALHLRFFERPLPMLHSWIDASFLAVFYEGSVSSRVSRCRRHFLSSVFCNFILLCCLLQFSKGVESPFLPDCSILHRVVSFKTALYQKRLPGSCLCSDCQSERGYRVVASVQTLSIRTMAGTAHDQWLHPVISSLFGILEAAATWYTLRSKDVLEFLRYRHYNM